MHARATATGAALAAGWLTAVAVLAILRAATGHPAAATLAGSPDQIAHGQVWRLLSSALVVQGPVILQIAGTAVLAAVLIDALGAGTFWAVALGGHVGGTLLAYAGIAAVWLIDRSALSGVLRAPDYGISAVWAACVGALCVAGLEHSIARPRAATAVGVVALLAFIALIPADGELFDVEHLLAFAIGAAIAGLRLRRRATAGARASSWST